MISIDRVYQKVLALSNKEQRGYITPQEFNLFADQAQMEIFEQYFYDINQWTRQHGNNHPYSDMVTNLQEKIDFFQTYSPARVEVAGGGWMNLYDHMRYSEPGERGNDLYRIGSIRVRYVSKGLTTWNEAQFATREELSLYDSSKLLKRVGDTARYESPTYSRFSSGGIDRIQIHPFPERSYVDNNYGGTDFTYVGVNGDTRVYPDRIRIFYTRKPLKPNWAYVVVNTKAMYNVSNAIDFELHPAEEGELIYKILRLAGVSMKRDDIMKAGQGLDMAQIQQEKQ